MIQFFFSFYNVTCFTVTYSFLIILILGICETPKPLKIWTSLIMINQYLLKNVRFLYTPMLVEMWITFSHHIIFSNHSRFISYKAYNFVRNIKGYPHQLHFEFRNYLYFDIFLIWNAVTCVFLFTISLHFVFCQYFYKCFHLNILINL